MLESGSHTIEATATATATGFKAPVTFRTRYLQDIGINPNSFANKGEREGRPTGRTPVIS